LYYEENLKDSASIYICVWHEAWNIQL